MSTSYCGSTSSVNSVDQFTKASNSKPCGISLVSSSANNRKNQSFPNRSLGGQTRISCPPQTVKTGVDKLEVSLHLDIGEPELFTRFAEFRKELQDGFSNTRVFPWRQGQDKFTVFAMQRMGNRFFPYIFRSGDITLMLANRKSTSRIQNCQIEIGSVSSQIDVFGIYRELIQWLSSYQFKVVKENITRTDLAADFIGINIQKLNIENRNRWISRGRKFAIYYENWNLTGIMVGKGSLALRIYDKALELKADKIKSQFFHKEQWGCEEGVAVTRVEFQLRREILKEFIIPVDTVEDLERNIETIWNYCCQKWAKHCCEDVDRENENRERAELSVFWKMVQDVGFHLPVRNKLINRRYKVQLHKNINQLLGQARGCLLSVAAACGHEKDDYFGIIATIQDAIGNEFAEYMADEKIRFERLFESRLKECYVGF